MWKELVSQALNKIWDISAYKDDLGRRFGPIVKGTVLEGDASLSLYVFCDLCPLTVCAGVTYREADKRIDLFCDSYIILATSKPAPSFFAQPSSWPHIQEGHTDLLILRPTKRTGLPLTTLHDVFRKFLIYLDSDMDDPTTATLAMRAASSLCATMGDCFESEIERSRTFDLCVKGLFPEWKHGYELKCSMESCTAKVGGVIRYSDTGLALLVLLADFVYAVLRDEWEAGRPEGARREIRQI